MIQIGFQWCTRGAGDASTDDDRRHFRLRLSHAELQFGMGDRGACAGTIRECQKIVERNPRIKNINISCLAEATFAFAESDQEQPGGGENAIEWLRICTGVMELKKQNHRQQSEEDQELLGRALTFLAFVHLEDMDDHVEASKIARAAEQHSPSAALSYIQYECALKRQDPDTALALLDKLAGSGVEWLNKCLEKACEKGIAESLDFDRCTVIARNVLENPTGVAERLLRMKPSAHPPECSAVCPQSRPKTNRCFELSWCGLAATTAQRFICVQRPPPITCTMGRSRNCARLRWNALQRPFMPATT